MIFSLEKPISLMRVFFLLCLVLLPVSVASAENLCGSASAEDVLLVRRVVANAVSGSSAEDSLYRESTALPKISASSVVIVQDTALCRQAVTALIQAWGSGDPAEPAWVIQIGPTRYLVYNNRQRSQGRTLGLIFDATFVRVGTIVL